ncbi:MAG: phosphoribosyl-ATP diphosphatase [Clostridiales Family XIII bacterium]|jgi:phosphoribosyl-ATP pyrophosphohydrolase|nr:phosphoribosyl-ATP diphosphatase [Clostridiales Family XIII bacterium]
MSDVIKELYEVILSRRTSADESSYTAYLFSEGLDKILKKVGEESAETIIAAKSLEAALANSFAEDKRADLTNEVADLIYHVLVMLAERGVAWDEIEDILAERAGKTGNLKTPRGAAR